jgi:DNA-directed RNA polymerase specialized sigma24 family protein
MAWDTVDLRTQMGLPVCDADRETILDAVEKAILKSDRDPETALRAAARIARKIHALKNLEAYAIRAVFRAMKKEGFEQAKKDSVVLSSTDVAVLPGPAGVGQIENRILVRELLDTLSSRDREIVMRRVSGDTFPEIDNEMKLKPRTAETRFRASKDILRKLLDQDLDRRTLTRGH